MNSIDRFHADNERIFRVYRWTEAMNDEGTEGDPYLPVPLGPAMKADLPDLETYTRRRPGERALYGSMARFPG